ncbi:MAG: hypothetical protein ACFE7A_06425 [Promethearchaeota archaeon]
MSSRKKRRKKYEEELRTEIGKETREIEHKEFKWGFALTLAGGIVVMAAAIFYLFGFFDLAAQISDPDDARILVQQGYMNLSLGVMNGFFIMAGGLLGRTERRAWFGGLMSFFYCIPVFTLGFGIINVIGGAIGIAGGILTIMKR